jgi:hypothetical protein
MRIARLEPLPAVGAREWGEQRLRADLPPGHTLVVDDARDGESSRGWPVIIHFCRVLDAAGAAVEHRVIVLYRFIHFAGVAELRSAKPFARADAAEVEALLEGEPDFGGEVCCLADVLEDESPDQP